MNSTNVSFEAVLTVVNGSVVDDGYLGWGFTVYSNLLIFVLVLISNSIALLLFARNAQARTPFAIYLMCLLLSNIFYAFLNYPLFIISSLYSTWKLSSGWCTVYLYAIYVAASGAMHSHLLITTNRIWALIWPHSYKNRHTKTTALLVCGVMWVYVHALLLPGVMLDDLYYRVSLTENNCYLNSDAQPQWTMAIQFLVFVIPEIFIVASYPFICYKQLRWRARFGRQVAAVSRNSSKRDPATGATNSRSHHSAQEALSATRTADRDGISVQRSEKRSHPFLVLTLLMLGIVVCWTPSNTFYTVWSFMDLTEYTKSLQVVLTLYALQGVLDPVFFIVALKDLREAFRNLC